MIFRNIPANDWALGSGKQSYLTGTPAIAANIKTRLQTFLGECFWATEAGVDWFNLLGTRGDEAKRRIALEARKCIADSYGVVQVNSLETSFSAASRSLTVSANVDTIYTRNVTVTTSI